MRERITTPNNRSQGMTDLLYLISGLSAKSNRGIRKGPAKPWAHLGNESANECLTERVKQYPC
jgi:hypothetical protein